MKIKTFKEFLEEKTIQLNLGKKIVPIIETNLKSGGLKEEDRNILINQLAIATKGYPEEFKQFRFLAKNTGQTYITGSNLLHHQLLKATGQSFSVGKLFLEGSMFPGILDKNFDLDTTISPENIDVRGFVSKYKNSDTLKEFWKEKFGFLKFFTNNNLSLLETTFKNIIKENIEEPAKNLDLNFN